MNIKPVRSRGRKKLNPSQHNLPPLLNLTSLQRDNQGHLPPKEFKKYLKRSNISPSRTSIFVVIAAASSAFSTCFTGGENWASQLAMALAKAGDICTTKYSKASWSKDIALGGCYDLDSTKKVDFILEKISDSTNAQNWLRRMLRWFPEEINGCEYGGSSSYTNWKYT